MLVILVSSAENVRFRTIDTVSYAYGRRQEGHPVEKNSALILFMVVASVFLPRPMEGMSCSNFHILSTCQLQHMRLDPLIFFHFYFCKCTLHICRVLFDIDGLFG